VCAGALGISSREAVNPPRFQCEGEALSIIEQAAKRLEELRRSGIDVASPWKATWEGPPSVDSLPPQPVPGMPATSGAQHIAGLTGSRVVELDLAKLEANGFISPFGERTRLADEFRAVKRPLLANVRGDSAAPIQRANCIMITSSTPGEGKTFTAINLALSMAMEVGSYVLLVDADVVRPMVLNRLGVPTEKGLLEKLQQPQLPLGDLILRTNIENLSILPAGEPSPRATELLGSEAMRRFVEDLAAPHSDQIVIFDAPPLLATPETRVLASHVGQIVVVVEAHKTRWRTLTEALALLEGCPVVMTMLNKTTASAGPSYGYGYGASA